MPDQSEIKEAARQMLERFGPEAKAQVELRIKELQKLDEGTALSFWQTVRQSLDEMLETQDQPSRVIAPERNSG